MLESRDQANADASQSTCPPKPQVGGLSQSAILRSLEFSIADEMPASIQARLPRPRTLAQAQTDSPSRHLREDRESTQCDPRFQGFQSSNDTNPADMEHTPQARPGAARRQETCPLSTSPRTSIVRHTGKATCAQPQNS